MDPKLWGPDVWRAIHFIALGYPLAPTETQRNQYRAFFEGLGPVLPCYACSVNFKRHLEHLPIGPALETGGEALFHWSVSLHNLVRSEVKSKGAPEPRPLTPRAVKDRLVTSAMTNAGLGPYGSWLTVDRAVAFSAGVGITIALICIAFAATVLLRRQYIKGSGRRV